VFGRAERLLEGKTTLDDPIAEYLREEERPRYKLSRKVARDSAPVGRI